MIVQPYVYFDGQCEEAIEFYKSVIDAQVLGLMRFSDNPEGADSAMAPRGCENKIMHAELQIGESVVMVSDGMCSGKPQFQGITLCLRVNSAEEAKRRFDALGHGGQVQMPFSETFFSPGFGMVADRFGVSWMVIVK